MLARWSADARLPRGPVPAAAKVFETVSVAQVSRSAEDARALHFLRPGDKVVMNRDRLLAAARDRALAMAAGYAPPAPPTYVLPGPSGRAGFNAAAQGFAKRGLATKHDLSVADGLAEVLSGGDADLLDMVTEQQVLDLERRVFMRLVRTYETLARVEHTLETGKPLRN
jgi:3-hydroxyacyl-CoA dehydrogenase